MRKKELIGNYKNSEPKEGRDVLFAAIGW